MSELLRRDFLELVGGSLALAGLSGCSVSEPDDVIVPYRDAQREALPGVPLYFATSACESGYATGLVAATYTGRPIKLEGNPDHPASLGKTGVFEQALLYELYDPNRSRTPRNPHGAIGHDELRRFLADRQKGDGLVLWLEPSSSPTLQRILAELRHRYPKATVGFFDPLAPLERWQATATCFGKTLEPVLDLKTAEVVACFDADLAESGPFHLRYAHDLASRRRVVRAGDLMSRLYVVESRFSPTGVLADFRLPVRHRDVGLVLALVFAEVALGTTPRDPTALKLAERIAALESLTPHGPWARTLARDLLIQRGKSAVVAGETQPAWVQALALATNSLLGNLGAVVRLVEPALLETRSNPAELLAKLDGAELAVFQGDPAGRLPGDLDFQKALEKARHSLHLGVHHNATSKLCGWHVPEAHVLESWGDARALDGTLSFTQPLVRPLFSGLSAIELVAGLVFGDAPAGRDLVRETHKDLALEEALRLGLVPDTASKPVDATFAWARADALIRPGLDTVRPDGRLELTLARDPRLLDGRFIDNPWLLELPQPFTRLTWENAAHLGPATAAERGVQDGDVVRLRVGEQVLDVPVAIVPGQPEGSVAATLGWGQPDKPGTNLYPLRHSAELWARSGVELAPTGIRRDLARTQTQISTEGRSVIREVTLADLHVPQPETPSLRTRLPELRWGMAIDLSLCTGCAGCVIACQAENNIPVVGKAGIKKSRVMHWLRLDHYLVGERFVMQPMLCQHCEKAPCEYVCPTAATTHSPDGLNEMVYNRCVGTRFCSNNCPYKVRRFNWFDYNRETRGSLALLMNPDVTVRARGVMEKCTFCVQRIRRAGIAARIGGKPIPDADSFTTACAQACPTSAIVFGDLSHPEAEVSRLWQSPRAYAVLGDLGTAPRIRYLARVRQT